MRVAGASVVEKRSYRTKSDHAPPPPLGEGARRSRRGNVRGVKHALLTATRVWVPLVIAIAGLVAIVIGHGRTTTAAAGVCLVLAALGVWLINWMFRLSVESNRDRDREEAARVYFDLHGRWPDEE
jgi:hypothetical protein